MIDASSYRYSSSDIGPSCHHNDLVPKVLELLAQLKAHRVFDLGCGNGYLANQLSSQGYDVTGVDPSKDGIANANCTYPELKLYNGSAYDDLCSRFGRFPCVVSLEVVEHVYAPREYAKTLFDLLEPGGAAIISTPYHGYIKNLVIAVFNRWDTHHSPLWDHGHIKFWSRATLSELLLDQGFESVDFHYVGRVAPIAKNMIAVAVRAR